MTLEDELTSALRGSYEAARARGYIATYFIQMLEEYGGLETAKRLLGTSPLPIHEIASQVGFADPLYFSRAFKAASGMSPRAYRQQANCTT